VPEMKCTHTVLLFASDGSGWAKYR